MTFSQYMTDWLYSDEGYYSKEIVIGKEGDFYTSVSSSRYFGGTIGNYLVGLIKEGKLPRNTTVCEIGAHQGYLISDLIQFVYTLDPTLIETLKFVIVEPFEENQKMQKKYFQDSFGDAITLHHVKDLSELEEEAGFVFANELLDAFTCELYEDGKMAYVEDNKLFWKEPIKEVEEFVKENNLRKGEVPLEIEPFILSLKKAFKKLEFVTFDYGEWEFLNRFTLRTYLKHETKPFEEIDFKEDFKKTDLTYDVPFKYTYELFEKHGFKGEYGTQVKA
ncbi:MAG: SAM-dependent methyltransferase, partial [Campylobacterales bacterium]|nr:SAM-dependent methyltransferase [Campylobacterales bacterium]